MLTGLLLVPMLCLFLVPGRGAIPELDRQAALSLRLPESLRGLPAPLRDLAVGGLVEVDRAVLRGLSRFGPRTRLRARFVEEDGSPAAGLRLVCNDGQYSLDTYSDSLGRVEFETWAVARDVVFELRVGDELFGERVLAHYWMSPGRDDDLGTLTRRKGATASGRVVDTEGQGIAGALVLASDPAARGRDLLTSLRSSGRMSRVCGTTIEDGSFELGWLPAEPLALFAMRFDVGGSVPIVLDLEPGARLDGLELRIDSSAWGRERRVRVVDESGEAVGGTWLHWIDRDDRGRNLARSTSGHDLAFFHDDIQALWTRDEEGRQSEVVRAPVPRELTTVLHPLSRRLIVQLHDEAGQPIRDARVACDPAVSGLEHVRFDRDRVRKGPREARETEPGRYETLVTDGGLRLYASAEGVPFATRLVEPSVEPSVESVPAARDDLPTLALEWTLRRAFGPRGRVTFEGRAIAGAEVRIELCEADGRSIRTRPDEVFLGQPVESAEDGGFALEARLPGLGLAADGPRFVRLFARFETRRLADDESTGVGEERGQRRTRDSLQPSARWLVAESSPLDVSALPQSIELSLRPAATVRGQLEIDGQTTAWQRRVELRSESRPVRREELGPDGRFEFDDLAAGDWTLLLLPPRHDPDAHGDFACDPLERPTLRREVSLESGEEVVMPLRLEWPPAVHVTGRFERDGRPLRHARLRLECEHSRAARVLFLDDEGCFDAWLPVREEVRWSLRGEWPRDAWGVEGRARVLDGTARIDEALDETRVERARAAAESRRSR